MEEEMRKAAIMDYMQGEYRKEIYTRLDHSKKWFFRWLKRHRTGNAEWYKEQSRAPKSQARETPKVRKELILTTRKRMEDETFTGAPFPSARTINRILKREGLTKKTSYVPKGVEYPYLIEPTVINNVPSGRSRRSPTYQGGREVLLPQRHRCFQPPGVCRVPENEGRRSGGGEPHEMLQSRWVSLSSCTSTMN